MDFSERIKELRSRNNLKQEDLASILNVEKVQLASGNEE